MLRHVTHARDAFEYFLLLATVHLCDREEWQRVDDGSMRDPGETSIKTVPCAADPTRVRRSESKDGTVMHEQHWDASSARRSFWQAVGQPEAPTWKLSGTQGTSAFWEFSEAPLPPPKRRCKFYSPKTAQSLS